MKWLRRVMVASILVSVAVSAPANADERRDRCTSQDAQTLFDHAVRGFDLLGQGITDRPIVDLVQRCQFRLYVDGETFTFHDDDVILGGIYYYLTKAEIEEKGWTRREAIADLEKIGERVWLAREFPDGSHGRLVEQRTRQPDNINYNHSSLGPVVYTHVAFTTRLPVGNYVCMYEQTYPGLESWVATMHLRIVPG